MRLLLFLTVIIVMLFTVGCAKSQSGVSSSKSESLPINQAANLFAFDFYYRAPIIGSYNLSIQPKENEAYMSFNSSHNSYVVAEKMVDISIISDILALFKKYDIYEWDGYNTKSDKGPLETDYFSMTINYGSGNMIFADGQEKLPENFHEFYTELHELTRNAAMTQLDAPPLKEGVDYSLYTALIASKTKEFGERTITPTYSYEDIELNEAYGVIYTDLIDLDNDGILELIIVSSDKSDLSNDMRHRYIGNHITIYTISKEDTLLKVGELPLLLLNSKHLSSGTEFTVNYSFVDGVCYIGTGTEVSDTHRQYYRYSADGFQLAVTFDTLLIADFGTTFSIDNKTVEQEEFRQHYYSFEQSAVTHSVSGTLSSELELIDNINNKTATFLSDYTIDG